MNRYILFIALTTGLLSTICQKEAFGGVSADEQNSDVSMTITKLQVNDQTLELTYNIKNDSDHDIWICDSVNIKSNRLDYEAYVAKDAQTLVIRKRFDLPGGNVVLESDFTGRYIRLRPGQEHADSLLVTLPPMMNRFFDAEIGKAKYTKRLALEIGYYDEDLRSLILDTVEVADKLDCDTSTLSYEYHEIYTRYFPGLWIARYFNDKLSSYFRDSVNSGDDEILMPPMSWGDIHLGEKVLRLTIDSVYIRCWGEPPLSETEPAGVTMALTGLDVNDTKLELSYKIKNNTDHDVWICDSVNTLRTFNIDVYLAEDAKTLVIMKRIGIVSEFCSIDRYRSSRHVRLRPAQEYSESLSVDVPVGPSVLYLDERANAEFASRLTIEIGFYNEDLLKRIRSIIEVAERFNYTNVRVPDYESDIIKSYFKGLLIARTFGGLSRFDEVYADVGELLIGPLYDFFGEQVLRIEVDGVHIPYDEFAPPYPPDPPHPKGMACFLAETPVWVDGMIMPISKVVTGQAVRRSLYTTPGSWPDRVEKVQEHTGTFEYRDIILESGNHIGVVDAHCFMLDTGEWIAAQNLKSGQSLRTLHGTVKIKSVTVRAEPYTGKVYNLKIKNSDEYIVGRDAVIVRDY
jgi:hypothetical protein